MSLEDNVYGKTYSDAKEQMDILTQAISDRVGTVFKNQKELSAWAKNYLLDKLVFSNSQHKFFCVSHKGEVLSEQAFKQYYGNVLLYNTDEGPVVWSPYGFMYFDSAYIFGEQSDGSHRPLYYRDYFVPTGYYNSSRDAFNIAKPFTTFAKETNRDTSFIYTYIKHIAGDCAMHLLAWLRAKLLYPTVKTQVVPIIISRAQGSGKTTFAEVICKGLFGKDNVIVSDQYDSSARFNADYADALIVCQEEKEETDKRNPAGAIKSRATATTIRKEQKGIDPIYQESYTDFIMTTNKDVPIKFDSRDDQRRFMIMEADEHFTRKESSLADEVFTKLYGYDANFNKKCTPFIDDKELIAQFKHELFTNKDIASVELRNFPHTAAYNRCFTLPRTSEAAEIEAILRSLAPFIRQTLLDKKVVMEIEDIGKLSDVINVTGALQYIPAFSNYAAFVAICRPLVFCELQSMKSFAHSTVERTLYDSKPWLIQEFGLALIPDMEPLLGGFTTVAGRYRTASAAKFCLLEDIDKVPFNSRGYVEEVEEESKVIDIPEDLLNFKFKNVVTDSLEQSAADIKKTENGIKLSDKPKDATAFRVNDKFKPDPSGCFETVNLMKPGTVSLKNKTQNIATLNRFLFESDETTSVIEQKERNKAQELIDICGDNATIDASEIYYDRLKIARDESMRIFNDGIACRIVYSGAKSYHIIVTVADAPTNIDEYKWLHAYLCNSLSKVLTFDSSTCDPARLTRSPVTFQRITHNYGLVITGTQDLIAENKDHIYDIKWRGIYEQWKKRPLKTYELKRNKPLYPTKREYVTAMEDIISGAFWTKTDYDGDRQRLFFPAYRILRILGYSHNDIWNDLIANNISNYKKKEDISYWTSRADSEIIQKIDSEIDAYDDEMEGRS